MSDTAATWLGRQTIAETRGFTPDGQKSGEQPTNASSFVQALGDRAGSGDALQGSAGLVGHAHEVARPEGSWVPGGVDPAQLTLQAMQSRSLGKVTPASELFGRPVGS